MTQFIRPFEILQRIVNTSYHLALYPKFSHVHNVFHVLIRRKYELDPFEALNLKEIEINEDMTKTKEPILIMDCKEKELRTKTIFCEGYLASSWTRRSNMGARGRYEKSLSTHVLILKHFVLNFKNKIPLCVV